MLKYLFQFISDGLELFLSHAENHVQRITDNFPRISNTIELIPVLLSRAFGTSE